MTTPETTPDTELAKLQAELEDALKAMEDRRAQFVREYLVDLNKAQAAIRAGYSARGARQIAFVMAQHPDVARALDLAKRVRALRTNITADAVIQELWAIATADPSELIEYRRCCCRYCWGKDFRYHETPAEALKRQAQWDRDQRAAAGSPKEEAKFADGFDDLGGSDFDETSDPNPDCPECRGQGEGRAYVRDTRDLSDEARKLYAGVKVTKEGVEVKMHDKGQALVNVGRHLGLFTDKLEANHTGRLTINVRRFTPESKPADPDADD